VDEIAQKLYFIVDTPTGEKKSVAIPLSLSSLAGSSILNNETINIADCYSDPRFDQAVDKQTGFKTKQLLCVPVANANGKVIGAIQIVNTSHGMPFGKEACLLVEAFKVYAQVGILHFKSKAVADQGVHFDVASLEAQEINLGYLVDLVVELCRAERGYIFVLDPALRRLSYLTAKDKLDAHQPCSDSYLAGSCVLNNEVINVGDYTIESRIIVVDADMRGLVCKQALCVPVCDSTGEVFGAIQVLNSHNGEHFSDACIEVLQAFRVYITLAIMNHRKQVAAHRSVRDCIDSAVDVDPSNLGFLTDTVVRLTKSARGSIYVVNKATNELTFLAENASGELSIPLNDQSVSGASIVHNEIINISNCYEDSRFNMKTDEKPGLKSRQMLCVPVADEHGEAIGGIQIINTHDGLPFGPHEFELVRAMRLFVQMAITKRQDNFQKLMVADPQQLATMSQKSMQRSSSYKKICS